MKRMSISIRRIMNTYMYLGICTSIGMSTSISINLGIDIKKYWTEYGY